MGESWSHLLLVEVVVRADLLRHSDAFHVEDLGTRQLICVLDWALADFLVVDSVVDSVLNSFIFLSFAVEIITLVSVLVSA